MKTAPEYWYDKSQPVPFVNKLLSKMYALLSSARKKYFDTHPQAVYHAEVPVIVVGNISVGGTGKTPLSIAIMNYLKQQGYQPGLISRGYGGKAKQYPQIVTADSDPVVMGDEPVLIAAQTDSPVVVDPVRKRGIPYLLGQYKNVDVVISDDGLQHYAMGRDIEILVIDGQRRFGNGLLLPAGPLRESIDRKQHVDMCVSNGLSQDNDEFEMKLSLGVLKVLNDTETRQISDFSNKKVHAIAGIGNPQRFFSALEAQEIEVIPHAFEDHYQFLESDCQFPDDLPVLMTEKDAVKCKQYDLENTWVVPVDAILSPEFYTQLLDKLRNVKRLNNG